MAECFCGCGRRIGFTSRGVNKQGRRTIGLLAKLRQVEMRVRGDKSQIRADLPTSPDRGAMIERLAARTDEPSEAAAALAQMDDDDLADLYETHTQIREQAQESVRTLIEDGEDFEEFWIAVVHGDAIPLPGSAREIKRDWTEWGRAGMQVCRMYDVPISRLGAFTGRV